MYIKFPDRSCLAALICASVATLIMVSLIMFLMLPDDRERNAIVWLVAFVGMEIRMRMSSGGVALCAALEASS